VLRRPRLLGLGLLPALISGVVYVAALITLIAFLPELTGSVTWFADDWASGWHDVLRISPVWRCSAPPRCWAC
jgi:CysZ protein